MESNKTPVLQPKNILKVTLSIGNQTVSSIAQLNDQIISDSRGPMSLYSACLGTLQEVTQSIYARAKAKSWNNLKEGE